MAKKSVYKDVTTENYIFTITSKTGNTKKV